MPTSSQNPSNPTDPPSKAGDDVPAARATLAKAASPRHETATEATQKALARDDGGNEAAEAPSSPTVLRPTKTVECNMMSYTDDEGVIRQIYMPKGTMSLACALYADNRFDDLARFPAWGE